MRPDRTLDIAIGHSDDVDAPDAVAEAAAACVARLGGPPRAAILFASIEYDPDEVVPALEQALPGTLVVGCSSDGEMSNRLGLCEDSVAMLAFGGSGLDFGAGMANDYEQDSYAAAARAIDIALDGRTETPRAAFVFPTGLQGNTDDALRAFRDRFGRDFPVFGGTAGDHWKLERCWSYGPGRWAPNAIPVLLVFGPLAFGHGVESGWVRVGEPLTVTRASGNVVYEIDGAPAARAFEAQFGHTVSQSLAELPLAVLTEGGESGYLRAVFGVDPETGALTLAGEIPEGARVSLTNSTTDRILAGARASTTQALARLQAEPAAALVISCAARKWLLGHAVVNEVTEICEGLREGTSDIPMLGFYSFGEIGPLDGASRYHNETCVVVTLGSAAA